MEEHTAENTQDLSDTSKRERSIISLSSAAFEQLLQIGIDLNHTYILEGINEGTDLTKHIQSPKLVGWKQTLIRKGYLDMQGLITDTGRNLLKQIGEGGTLLVKRQKEKREMVISDFELWWKAYPSSDTFIYKNRTFRGSRALRINKSECVAKMNKILAEGEYTIKEMVEALELEKRQKMEESVRIGQNKMSYFQNSLTYLNQRTYEPWIEIIKTTPAEELNKSNNPNVVKRIDI